MALYQNVGGVIKTINTLTQNVGGSLKTINTLHQNVGGTLYQIHPDVASNENRLVVTYTVNHSIGGTVHSSSTEYGILKSNNTKTIDLSISDDGYEVGTGRSINDKFFTYDPVYALDACKLTVNMKAVGNSSATFSINGETKGHVSGNGFNIPPSYNNTFKLNTNDYISASSRVTSGLNYGGTITFTITISPPNFIEK